jgi:hypothetical protein
MLFASWPCWAGDGMVSCDGMVDGTCVRADVCERMARV